MCQGPKKSGMKKLYSRAMMNESGFACSETKIGISIHAQINFNLIKTSNFETKTSTFGKKMVNI